MTQVQNVTEQRLARDRIIELLVARDGATCQYPDCGKELDLTIDNDDDPRFVTIDHWMPKSHMLALGQSWEEIWELSNLKLMEKRCNARKGDRIPNEDGTLPDRPVRKFRYRRDKRAGRPELCVECDNGHNLFVGEICASCGCDAQRFPRWAKVKANECDHEISWCWACSIGWVERPNSIGVAMRQADSDELGEW